MTTNVELSEEQQKVVNIEEGPIYVKASAGSGKTRVLTERIRVLLGKTKKKILALTFTNKAGEEIRKRLNGISTVENRVFIGTFHGFCQKVLENHGHLIGLKRTLHIFEDEDERLELVGQAINLTPSYFSCYQNKNKKEQKKSKYKILGSIEPGGGDKTAHSWGDKIGHSTRWFRVTLLFLS